MKIQTDFSAIGPTIFELWVMKTELSIMETTNSNSTLIFHNNWNLVFSISPYFLSSNQNHLPNLIKIFSWHSSSKV